MSVGRPRAIALLGLRGSGKSTLAPSLAARLGRTWLDLDQELADAAADRGLVAPGATAGRVLAQCGEPAFRALEAETLAAVLRRAPSGVVACGGGVVESEQARALLGRGARCVWLDPPLGVLVARLEAEPGDRPPLLGLGGAADELAALHRRRRVWFEGLAELRATEDLPPEVLAENLARALS